MEKTVLLHCSLTDMAEKAVLLHCSLTDMAEKAVLLHCSLTDMAEKAVLLHCSLTDMTEKAVLLHCSPTYVFVGEWKRQTFHPVSSTSSACADDGKDDTCRVLLQVRQCPAHTVARLTSSLLSGL